MNQSIGKLVARAHRAATPLVAVTTPDPFATIMSLSESLTRDSSVKGLFSWDLVRGLPLNPAAEQIVKALQASGVAADPAATMNPVQVLADVLPKMPGDTAVFIYNANALMADSALRQAIALLRNPFKMDARMLILLGTAFDFPADLANDIITFDESLPTRAELGVLVSKQFENADLTPPAPDVVERAVDAVQGLALFTAEQVIAMSLRADGLDFDALWSRKREAIDRTAGLSVWKGGETFADIGGVAGFKEYFGSITNSKARPGGIVFIDEIEKGMAGATGGDNTGASQNQHGYLLKFMSDTDAMGILCVGPPGTSKSLAAKALGNESQIPCIAFDLGGTKHSHLGESEARMRNALKVIDAVTGGRPLFIATCNNLSVLSPELQRRFKDGTFMFDIPSAEDRPKIWSIHCEKRGLDVNQPKPEDENWTGADIAVCVQKAWAMDVSLVEAAKWVTPQIKRAPEKIAALRAEANGRYLDASKGGTFTVGEPEAAKPEGRRKIQFKD